MHDEQEEDGPLPTEEDRREALDDMRTAALELLKLIDIERRSASGGPSWHNVEVALLDIREAWEGAKACEICAAMA